jgi:hypothetical protein
MDHYVERKLTNEQVEEIRTAYNKGKSKTWIAKNYSITTERIDAIIHRPAFCLIL